MSGGIFFARPVSGLQVEGRPLQVPTDSSSTIVTTVSRGYFLTSGIAIEEGRAFTDVDRPTSLPVAIVNAKLARDWARSRSWRVICPRGEPRASMRSSRFASRDAGGRRSHAKRAEEISRRGRRRAEGAADTETEEDALTPSACPRAPREILSARSARDLRVLRHPSLSASVG